ncbi:hypothetical protein ACFLYW_04020, partial [Thermodesulfobacteriota bacterium]
LELAYKLISLKKEIRELLIREKKLKTEFTPIIEKVGRVYVEGNIIRYSKQKLYVIFNRKSVLQYIRQNYGEPIAKKIDEDCSITKQRKPFIGIQLRRRFICL